MNSDRTRVNCVEGWLVVSSTSEVERVSHLVFVSWSTPRLAVVLDPVLNVRTLAVVQLCVWLAPTRRSLGLGGVELFQKDVRIEGGLSS